MQPLKDVDHAIFTVSKLNQAKNIHFSIPCATLIIFISGREFAQKNGWTGFINLLQNRLSIKRYTQFQRIAIHACIEKVRSNLWHESWRNIPINTTGLELKNLLLQHTDFHLPGRNCYSPTQLDVWENLAKTAALKGQHQRTLELANFIIPALFGSINREQDNSFLKNMYQFYLEILNSDWVKAFEWVRETPSKIYRIFAERLFQEDPLFVKEILQKLPSCLEKDRLLVEFYGKLAIQSAENLEDHQALEQLKLCLPNRRIKETEYIFFDIHEIFGKLEDSFLSRPSKNWEAVCELWTIRTVTVEDRFQPRIFFAETLYQEDPLFVKEILQRLPSCQEKNWFLVQFYGNLAIQSAKNHEDHQALEQLKLCFPNKIIKETNFGISEFFKMLEESFLSRPSKNWEALCELWKIRTVKIEDQVVAHYSMDRFEDELLSLEPIKCQEIISTLSDEEAREIYGNLAFRAYWKKKDQDAYTYIQLAIPPLEFDQEFSRLKKIFLKLISYYAMDQKWEQALKIFEISPQALRKRKKNKWGLNAGFQIFDEESREAKSLSEETREKIKSIINAD